MAGRGVDVQSVAEGAGGIQQQADHAQVLCPLEECGGGAEMEDEHSESAGCHVSQADSFEPVLTRGQGGHS